MSWLRAAVIKAVEAGAGGKDNITRTVRSYAGTVVYHAGNAVVEGAKIIQDRIVSPFSFFSLSQLYMFKWRLVQLASFLIF